MVMSFSKLTLMVEGEGFHRRACIAHCSLHVAALNSRCLHLLLPNTRPTHSDASLQHSSPTSSTSFPSTPTCFVYESSLAPSLRSTRPAFKELECGHRSW